MAKIIDLCAAGAEADFTVADGFDVTSGEIHVSDAADLVFGTDDDFTVSYDNGLNKLTVVGANGKSLEITTAGVGDVTVNGVLVTASGSVSLPEDIQLEDGKKVYLDTQGDVSITAVANDVVLAYASGATLTLPTATAGKVVAGGTPAALIADPAGGGTVDAEARTAVAAIIDALQAFGIVLNA